MDSRKFNIITFLLLLAEEVKSHGKMTRREKIGHFKRVSLRRQRWESRFVKQVKQVLNKQFKEIADKINSTNLNPSIVDHLPMTGIDKVINDIYIAVGSDFARENYRTMKAISGTMEIKQDEEDVFEEEMRWYVRNKVGNRIKSINASSREMAKGIIRRVIDEATAEGIGADALASRVKKELINQGIQMNTWRALRIARTEVMTASNAGTLVSARATGEAFEKYWIPTYDSRTRDTHLVMEAQNPKDQDEAFMVGGFPAECPLDPDLPPEEVINCRCVLVTQTKWGGM